MSKEDIFDVDIDLRVFASMPLHVQKLRDSDFNLTATDAEFRAGILLWGASWHQVPAGSLPKNDSALAQLAGFGRDEKAWKKVKKMALYGFEEGEDDRLYHPFICEKAQEAWAKVKDAEKKKVKDRARKRKGRPKEFQRNSDGKDADSPSDFHGIPRPNGREGKGNGRDTPVRGDKSPSGIPKEQPGTEETIDSQLYRRGKEILGPSAGGIITKLRKRDGDEKSLKAIEWAATMADPMAWIVRHIEGEGPPDDNRPSWFNPKYHYMENGKAYRLKEPGTRAMPPY